jgi:hypothetical protein
VYAYFVVETARGEKLVNVGDWIVTYPSGNIYVCPADAFTLGYDRMAAETVDAGRSARHPVVGSPANLVQLPGRMMITAVSPLITSG